MLLVACCKCCRQAHRLHFALQLMSFALNILTLSQAWAHTGTNGMQLCTVGPAKISVCFISPTMTDDITQQGGKAVAIPSHIRGATPEVKA